MNNFDRIIQKLLSDESFAAELIANPHDTLVASGVEPTPEVVSALEQLDAGSLNRLATAFGQQQAAAF